MKKLVMVALVMLFSASTFAASKVGHTNEKQCDKIANSSSRKSLEVISSKEESAKSEETVITR